MQVQELLQLRGTEQHLMLPKVELDTLEQSLYLTEQIIQGLTPEATFELLGGSEKDVDEMFNKIYNEVYDVMYGTFVKSGRKIEASNLGYLDKLSDSVEEEMRCNSLSYFITSCLPFFEMSWHHYQWSQIPERWKKFLVLAARDHGKSFMFSNAYPAWMLYKYKPKTPKERINNRGFLFSFSMVQAIDLLEILKGTIEDSDVLRDRLYNKDKWSKMDITCKNRARLTVKGFGSAVRGAHPYWIMIDDGLKDNVLYSSEQNQKTIDYFHAVVENLLTPGGTMGIVGTPFRSNDLYGHLKTKENWKVFEYPGIFPDGTTLWPSRWKFDDLMEKRMSQGNLIFSREILVKPITAESTLFPMELLNTAFLRMDEFTLVNSRESFPIKFSKVITGCDFAISGNVGSDYSVYLTWGIDDTDKMWLLNVVRGQGMSYQEQMGHLKSINMNFRPDMMVFENNVFQQIFVDEASKAGLPVVGVTTTSKKNDLREGLPSLAIAFGRGQFKIPIGDQRSRDFADLLVSEFSSVAFTDKGLQSTSEHDDIAFATYKSVEGTRMITVNSFNYTMV